MTGPQHGADQKLSSWRLLKNLPVVPEGASRASQEGVSAPSDECLYPRQLLMSVAT